MSRPPAMAVAISKCACAQPLPLLFAVRIDQKDAQMKMSKPLFAARALLAGLLTFVVSQSALAAFTPAQVPLSLGGRVEPNIMFLLDDSGSMEWAYMPDEIKQDISRNDCSYLSRSGSDYYYQCAES